MSREHGDATSLHGIGVAPGTGRTVRLCRVVSSALVLGSTQPLEDVDHSAAVRNGYHVVRRHSGGGAVLVEPDAVVWVDVVIPRSDPLWEDDVGRAFSWLGQAWAAALVEVGLPEAEVHRGGLVASRWSSKVCFAGLGPGEVTIGGRKVVGMAQRRTKHGALFQCAVPREWRPERLLDVLVVSPRERATGAELDDWVRPVPEASVADLEAALVGQLP